MLLRHLLITRLNLRVSYANTETHLPSAEWFEERFQLFNRFTVPSVRAQTHDQFEWLVMMDPDSPLEQVRRVSRVLPEHGRIVFHPAGVKLRQTINRHVAEARPDWLITSRLDSDDVLHSRFIADIQEVWARERARGRAFSIDFPQVYYLDVQTACMRQRIPSHATPFISAVEPRAEDFDTSMFPHPSVSRIFPAVNVPTPRTMMLIHGGNNETLMPTRRPLDMVRRAIRRRPQIRNLSRGQAARVAAEFGDGVAALTASAR